MNKEDKNNIEIYKIAVSYHQKESELFWNRFNIGITINVGLLTAYNFF